MNAPIAPAFEGMTGSVGDCPIPVDTLGRRGFVDRVIERLQVYVPTQLKAWEGSPSVYDVESMALKGTVTLAQPEDFVEWRDAFTLAESENTSRLLVVTGALSHTKRLEDWNSAETLVRHLLGAWGARAEPPLGLGEQSRWCTRLCRDYRKLPPAVRRAEIRADERAGRGL